MAKENQEYFWGLDIGTNSVGYAVTDEMYNLIKHTGEPMWGAHVFEEGASKGERRGFRTARRRLDRKQQRILLTQEIFAKEIAKIDSKFFVRLKESQLFREDISVDRESVVFNDENYKDCDYHREYPTIHHLLQELIVSDTHHDVRLVYLAVAWLMAHRGHFLSEVDKHKVSELRNFGPLYERFIDYFDEPLWECNIQEFQRILQLKTSVRNKEKAFFELLNHKKKYNDEEDKEQFGCSRNALIKLLAGGTIKPDKIFMNGEYSELDSVSLTMADDKFQEILVSLEEDAELLIRLRGISDWTVLASVYGENEAKASGENDTISAAKIKVYEQHEKDLAFLKRVVKKYLRDKYEEVFCKAVPCNYVSYGGNTKKLKKSEIKKCNQEEFCKYIEKIVKDVVADQADQDNFADMKERLELRTFMPKQVTGDNRVIPYQLYWNELDLILKKASQYLPFLLEKVDGISNVDKLLMVFEFRVPYYVGPLRTDNSANAWMKRKADGKIYPWNFNEMVDEDASEKAFIERMTNTCSYLAGEPVLPKCSLLYERFMVLNEINNLKVNGNPIPVEAKQQVYQCFRERKRVTVKMVTETLRSIGIMKKAEVLSGIDTSIKSSLKSYHDFKRLRESGQLKESEIEDIISHITFSEDRMRLNKWLERTYPHLSKEDRTYITRLKYQEFGRLSKKVLAEFPGVNKETGEENSVIYFMWETNHNFAEITHSDLYTFAENIKDFTEQYYSQNHYSVDMLLDDMYLSNAVKRQIYRTLSVVKDVNKTMKKAPKRIFVEMARGGGEKGVRTQSRRSKIEELYKNYDQQEIREISKELGEKTDNQLQNNVLFLYFMQLGRDMYSGDAIDIEQLASGKYNIDHIYPQSLVKDDSINNKVLVSSKLNSDKGDRYPLPQSWRDKMEALWKKLLHNNLITEIKYQRLTRCQPFSDQEKTEFINRQLVETTQSSKAVTVLLKKMFPETQIVYVKAGIVSDYRHEFNLIKNRTVNDLHHAKDAYLNIVCGNVYYCRFTKNFRVDQQYSIKTKTLFTHQVKENNRVIWDGEHSIGKVRKIVLKNNVHYTRFAFERKGGFFDQMPIKAKADLVPRKKGMDTEKYGGYNKPTASFFLITRYEELGKKSKQDIMFVPVERLIADKIMESEETAKSEMKKAIAGVLSKPTDNIQVLGFPMGLRKIKVNTKLSLDGFNICITGKANGGSILSVSPQTPFIFSNEWERYVKRLEEYKNKKVKNPKLILDEEHDGISVEKNMKLYEIILEKLEQPIFSKTFEVVKLYAHSGKMMFEKDTAEEQIGTLLSLVTVFATGRTMACDLRKIGGKEKSGKLSLSTKVSNWTKYSDVRIIDESASGIWSHTSMNLLELL